MAYLATLLSVCQTPEVSHNSQKNGARAKVAQSIFVVEKVAQACTKLVTQHINLELRASAAMLSSYQSTTRQALWQNCEER